LRPTAKLPDLNDDPGGSLPPAITTL